MVRSLSLAALVACASAAALPVYAQAYPVKPVRVVVPFPPSGAADLLTRTLGQKLGEAWGQQLVVDNRPGAGGNLGLEIVAKAPPDGYTAVMAAVTTNAIGMSTYAKLGYNLERDLAPVSLVGNVPHILVAHPTLPARNVKELIALARSRPGELNFASQGPGTLSHLEQELLKQMAAFRALHVPYKGSAPGIADLMAGHVVLFFDSIPSALPHVKTGRVRALGVASSTRSPALPDVPAIGETVKGFEADSWFGLMVPAGTSRDVIAKLNGDVQKALGQQEVKDRLLAVGGFVTPGGPPELAARVKADVAKWARVVRTAGIKAE
ncbi:MAG TPA: tripartite tricarboxylate transporter substrate binding protein [Burkholderiales bacterium]|nr:tripartite tricarboxylate transporter substrate binding protein [Burkholderiales bacterium]